MTRIRALVGLVAVVVVHGWNRLVRTRDRPVPTAGGTVDHPRIVEHERGWRTFLRGFDAHHGPDGGPDRSPAEGRLWRGLAAWVASGLLRGYTVGNDVYLCPHTPLAVRVHQVGHTPAMGELFDPIVRERRPDGGLPDEPLRTLDVMLPGGLPHTFLRLTDRRGLRGAYRAWRFDGRIDRVRE